MMHKNYRHVSIQSNYGIIKIQKYAIIISIAGALYGNLTRCAVLAFLGQICALVQQTD